jgi:hypothetical protein
LVLGAILSAAIMRSVLHPEEKRLAYLRLGKRGDASCWSCR